MSKEILNMTPKYLGIIVFFYTFIEYSLMPTPLRLRSFLWLYGDWLN